MTCLLFLLNFFLIIPMLWTFYHKYIKFSFGYCGFSILFKKFFPHLVFKSYSTYIYSIRFKLPLINVFNETDTIFVSYYWIPISLQIMPHLLYTTFRNEWTYCVLTHWSNSQSLNHQAFQWWVERTLFTECN